MSWYTDRPAHRKSDGTLIAVAESVHRRTGARNMREHRTMLQRAAKIRNEHTLPERRRSFRRAKAASKGS